MCSRKSQRLIFSAVAALFAFCGCDREALLGSSDAVEEDGASDEATPALTAESFIDDHDEIEPVDDGPEFIHDKSVQVSILGYHRFSRTATPSDMITRTDRFREEMQMLADAEIGVISMEDFLSWKRGEINIPDPSVVITIDDGFDSIHDEAYPVLKEFGFPFTFFIYTNFLGGSGRTLSVDEIKEMMKNGGTLGCHSVSHPYVNKVRTERNKGPEAYTKFLRKEMVESAKILEEKIGVRPTVYAYPGGYYADDMFEVANEAGYEGLFTVNPAKTVFTTSNYEINRYVIHGDKPYTFDNATSFRGVPLGRKTLVAAEGEVIEKESLELLPEDGSEILHRSPLISANLSKVGAIDPESLSMRVSGIGKVDPFFDVETGVVSWQVDRRLRVDEVAVFLSWKLEGAEEYEPALTWRFKIDRVGSLLEQFAGGGKGEATRDLEGELEGAGF